MTVYIFKKNQEEKIKTEMFGVATRTEIAEMLGISKAALNNRYYLCKKDINKAISYYINDERIKKAIFIPYNGNDMTINEISMLEGVCYGTIYRWYREGADIQQSILQYKESVKENSASVGSVNSSQSVSNKISREKSNKNSNFGVCYIGMNLK